MKFENPEVFEQISRKNSGKQVKTGSIDEKFYSTYRTTVG
jgi:hypothetical protein